MINYLELQGYIKVKWNKMELGRIYDEPEGWVYRPKGCGGRVESERFNKLSDLKRHLEHGDCDV